MAKSYTDELAQWATKRQGKARERNLVIFHGLQDDVRAALDAGYSSKTIWAHMQDQGRIDFGYETFLMYVNRVIKTARSAKPSHRSGTEAMAVEGTVEATQKANSPASSVAEPLSTRSPHSANPASHSTTSTPTSTSTPNHLTRRTGMPTFKFNPIPQREENA